MKRISLLKRTSLVVVIVIVLVMAIAYPVGASWYAGNSRTSVYGVSAYITTPVSAPDPAIGGGTSSWVSTAPYSGHPGWVQTGWGYAPTFGWDPAICYAEYKTDTGYFRQYYYGTQAWGTYKVYKLNYGYYGWEVYIDNDLKFIVGGFASPPIGVHGHSEVHDSSLNELYTHFIGVQYKNSGGSWLNFDQALWREDAPYVVEPYSLSFYRCRGPE